MAGRKNLAIELVDFPSELNLHLVKGNSSHVLLPESSFYPFISHYCRLYIFLVFPHQYHQFPWNPVFSYDFPMIFPWFSHISHDSPMVLWCFADSLLANSAYAAPLMAQVALGFTVFTISSIASWPSMVFRFLGATWWRQVWWKKLHL